MSILVKGNRKNIYKYISSVFILFKIILFFKLDYSIYLNVFYLFYFI